MKKKWKIVISSALALLCLAAVLFVFRVWRSLEAVDDSYAQWDAALALIHHMKTHDGSWPKGWAELEESYNSTPVLRGPGRGWDNLKSRVDVDFTAIPSQLSSASPNGDKPPFKVVWLRNGKNRHWSGAEPNTLIFEYLTTESTEQTPQGDVLKAAPEE